MPCVVNYTSWDGKPLSMNYASEELARKIMDSYGYKYFSVTNGIQLDLFKKERFIYEGEQHNDK